MITSMIFFPEKTFYEKPEDYGYAYGNVFFQAVDGIRLHGWFLKTPEEERGVILFFHGNAGNISHRLFKVKGWIERGFSSFLFDYRGYGKSEGKIEHQADVMRDSEAALHWLGDVRQIPLSRVILYGESLGTHPAIQLGSYNRVAAVVLEAPFTSFFDLAKAHYPFVPKVFLKDFEFANQGKIAELKAPLFILHGTRDDICSVAMGEALFEKAPEPKSFFTIEGGTHNDLLTSAGDDYWEKPYQFVVKHLA